MKEGSDFLRVITIIVVITITIIVILVIDTHTHTRVYCACACISYEPSWLRRGGRVVAKYLVVP